MNFRSSQQPPLEYSQRITSETLIDCRRLSSKCRRLQPARQHDLWQIAEARRELGLPIYNFAVARAQGAMPDPLTRAGIHELHGASSRFASPGGIYELREAALRWLGLEDEYTANNVSITAGATQALLNVLLATCDSGDVVLLGSVPSLSYIPTCRLASTTPVVVQPMTVRTNDLKIRWEDLVKCLEHHPKARVFVLGSPGDPTGQVYSPAEIQTMLQVCADHGVYFVLDRRHWRLMLHNSEYPTPLLDEGTKAWLVQIDSISYSFPHTAGLRVGWVVGPPDVIEVIGVVQSHYQPGPSDPSQQIALAALSSPYPGDLQSELKDKYDLFRSYADRILGVDILPTIGTFFSFWDVRALFGLNSPDGQTLSCSDDIAEYLLESSGVAVIPGSCFSQEGYLRFSFSASDDVIVEGMEATRRALHALM